MTATTFQIGQDAPLPEEMQGRWVAADEPTAHLVIEGGHIACFGQTVEYDYKEIKRGDGWIAVSLKINSKGDEDTFQRKNITELVITPKGEFHAYNVKLSTHFVRSP